MVRGPKAAAADPPLTPSGRSGSRTYEKGRRPKSLRPAAPPPCPAFCPLARTTPSSSLWNASSTGTRLVFKIAIAQPYCRLPSSAAAHATHSAAGSSLRSAGLGVGGADIALAPPPGIYALCAALRPTVYH